MPSSYPSPLQLGFTSAPHRAIIMWMLKVLSILTISLVMPTSSALAAVPEAPGPLGKQTPWLAYLFAVVLIGVVCLGTFKPSKRSHLD